MTEEWEQYEPGLIIGRIDWVNARLILCWAVYGDELVRDEQWPDYILDMSDLKRAAHETSQPRAYFDSYALYVLSVAQDYLGEFFREGPTDDIPYSRHLIYAQGKDGDEGPIGIKNVHFIRDGRHG